MTNTAFSSRLRAVLQFWPLLVVAVLGAAVYAHTLDVPFYLDDYASIQENPAVYEWQGFIELWKFAPMRFAGYLSFALNYQLHQFDVAGYHVLNIAVHILTGWAVFWLARVLLRLPQVETTPVSATWLPFLAALLFVLHPLHTQGVTYIVQRLSAMAALFYLATLASYIHLRLSRVRPQQALWGAACAVFAVAAIFTKQNTITLPVLLLFTELLFFSRTWRMRGIAVGIVVLIAVLLWMLVAFSMKHNPFTFSLETLDTITHEALETSRAEYLATQTQVLWWYLRLFVWPVDLRVDYAFPLTDFSNAMVWVATAGHLAVLGFAVWSLQRRPLPGFLIIFYYLAHSVESGLIPITDVVFEHRTYLPNTILCILTGWLILRWWPQWPRAKAMQLAGVAVLAVILAAFATLTWQRNQVWRDPIALWQSNTRLAPDKDRPWALLGKAWLEQGEPEKAAQVLRHAIDLQSRDKGEVDAVDVINLFVALKQQGRFQEALALGRQMENQHMSDLLKSKLYINQGNIYFQAGRFWQAETYYKKAIGVYPNSILARANLASVMAQQERYREALVLYEKVLELDPSNEHYRRNYETLRKFMEK